MSHSDAAAGGVGVGVGWDIEEVSGSVFYVETVQTENVSQKKDEKKKRHFCFPFTMAVVELLL